MNKRRRLTKSERHQVFLKTNGRCAYCGCELSCNKKGGKYPVMRIDHLVALARGGADEIENMLPSCHSCNHYKSTMTLEGFRESIERFAFVLKRDCVTYKNAMRFGQVIETPHDVVFYFENLNEGMRDCR